MPVALYINITNVICSCETHSQRINFVIVLRWVRLKVKYPLVQCQPTQGTRAESGTRKDFLGTRHSLLSQFLLFCLTSVSIALKICVYIHISDCVEIVYELPLLPNNTAVKHFYINRERCEVLAGYLSLGRQPGGDWTNT